MPTFTMRRSVLGAVLAILVAIAASVTVIAGQRHRERGLDDQVRSLGPASVHPQSPGHPDRPDQLDPRQDGQLSASQQPPPPDHSGELQLDARDDLDLARGRIREG